MFKQRFQWNWKLSNAFCKNATFIKMLERFDHFGHNFEKERDGKKRIKYENRTIIHANHAVVCNGTNVLMAIEIQFSVSSVNELRLQTHKHVHRYTIDRELKEIRCILRTPYLFFSFRVFHFIVRADLFTQCTSTCCCVQMAQQHITKRICWENFNASDLHRMISDSESHSEKRKHQQNGTIFKSWHN